MTATTVSLPQRWVLLRGLMRDARHWGDFPDQLRRQFPQTAIECVDLPGNGLRHREHSPARVADMADHCRQVLRERGLPPPQGIIAMSLGAMVAADWASRHPEEITAAVLINTSLRPFSRFHQRLRPVAYAPLLRLLLTQPSERRIEQTVLALTSRLRESDDRCVDDWIAWRRSHPVSRANTLRQLLAAARFHAASVAPPVPLLLLAGRRDGLVDPQCSRRLAAAWQCPLIEHPTAGHDLPLDDGEWVVRKIAQWLNTTGIGGNASSSRASAKR